MKNELQHNLKRKINNKQGLKFAEGSWRRRFELRCYKRAFQENYVVEENYDFSNSAYCYKEQKIGEALTFIYWTNSKYFLHLKMHAIAGDNF